MRKHREALSSVNLTNGPGKLCQATRIDRKLDGVDLSATDSPLIIAKNPRVKTFLKQRGPVITTTRIGITKAAHLPLRFYLDASAFISKRIRAAQ